MDTITVNGVEYIAKSQAQYSEPSGDLKIVVLQRGWVMVGKLERSGSECKLHKASVIRNWGTKKGLGEIAAGGPTKDTVLDACNGLVEFDYLTVVAAISCSEAKWAKHL